MDGMPRKVCNQLGKLSPRHDDWAAGGGGGLSGTGLPYTFRFCLGVEHANKWRSRILVFRGHTNE